MWFLCHSVKPRSYLIHPFYTCMSKLSTHTHSHTCPYGDPSPMADIPTPPSTPRSASPTPLYHAFDHGSQWRLWRVLRAPLPSCCQGLCHYNWLAQPSAAATLALSTTSGNTDAWCAFMCLCTYLWLCANTHVCAFIHRLIFVYICGIACCFIWNSLPCVNG